jgi:hypothetical protein
MTVWYILWPSGIFYAPISSRFGMLFLEKSGKPDLFTLFHINPQTVCKTVSSERSDQDCQMVFFIPKMHIFEYLGIENCLYFMVIWYFCPLLVCCIPRKI